MISFREFVKESKIPNMFYSTKYRLPTDEDLVEIDSCNLSAKEIVNGFSYTIIGKGLRSAENTRLITKSLEMLHAMFPNPKYKKAIELYKEDEYRGRS